MFKVILIFSLLLNCALAFANSSAVILQYHHVSDETPASTSISPEKFKAHLNWIKEHNVGRSFEELWLIREQCIANLSE